MNVAVIQEHVHASRGGAETSTRELAEALAALGARVTLITRASPPTRDFAAPGVSVQALSVPLRGRAAATRAFIAAADACCRDRGFDVVHAITPCPAATVYQPRGGLYADAIAGSLAMVPSRLWRGVRAWARSWNRRQQFLMDVETRLLDGPAPPVVAAVSDRVRQQVLRRRPGFPAQRVRVVFNGTACEALPADDAKAARRDIRRRLGLSDAAPLVLFMAHNFRLKGLAELLDAAQGRSWHVAIAGRGPIGPYARRAARLGCTARVHFVGPQAEARPWYAAADVLAHPTWYDPCSRVVLEALVCGLPVVTTRLNGAAEAIPDGCGVVVDRPDDRNALGAAIDAAAGATMRAAVRDVAEALRERLSMRRHARELMELYHALEGSGGEGRV
jgi:UDP-glucose:(heptosyl)LPS alpha-1,3-glucosyltransferase